MQERPEGELRDFVRILCDVVRVLCEVVSALCDAVPMLYDDMRGVGVRSRLL
jgi:hypothetical protein